MAGTPEGAILRSMGGDMAEAIEKKTRLDLRAVTDPGPLMIIAQLRRTAKAMFPDIQRKDGERMVQPRLSRVLRKLDECEARVRTGQFMDWQRGLHQDLSIMSLGLGNIDDAVDLDEVLAPGLDGYEDEEVQE